jgi:FtsP/CotA-like multicopper oxidase with cupredoxin domain
MDTRQTPRCSRRDFIRISGAGVGLLAVGRIGGEAFAINANDLTATSGVLAPTDIAKFQAPMLIPPAMPRSGRMKLRNGKRADQYRIAMRQFQQQILPPGMPATTVWGYGSVGTGGPQIFNAPSLTIEAQYDTPVRVTWINQLVDRRGGYLPHLLPVDPTLHWANPGGGVAGRDMRPVFDATPGPYTGPVPTVTHLHGAIGVGDESDGYAEAWFLPAATNIPTGYATDGTWYRFFADKAATRYGVRWQPGSATFQYPNTGRAAADWYHDHTLGMTRLNVYAGPAGFYIIRGGPGDVVLDARNRSRAKLPGPAPAEGDPAGMAYFEMPMAIQDRSFRTDGSLFYPDTREFFDGITGHFIPDGEFSPIWNPEFFGNTLMVNGATWPFQRVEQRRYRLRLLNGCQSRFLILDFGQIPGVQVWQIGNEGGFLAAPVDTTGEHGNRLLMAPAERADVIVDFTNVPAGDWVLANLGPDEPFGGGEPGVDFVPADPGTTGQVLAFRVVPATGPDRSTPPQFLVLPRAPLVPQPVRSRQLALIEMMGMGHDALGDMVEGPTEALLGNVVGGEPVPAMWMDPVTENPGAGDTELWEMYNTTGDAHPMHVHAVKFEVVNREPLVHGEDGELVVPFELTGELRPPEPWETGRKDTVIAYPGEVTRIKATFDTPGQYVWHCHIVEHEDNEMMRPFRIGPEQVGQPMPHTHMP